MHGWMLCPRGTGDVIRCNEEVKTGGQAVHSQFEIVTVMDNGVSGRRESERERNKKTDSESETDRDRDCAFLILKKKNER